MRINPIAPMLWANPELRPEDLWQGRPNFLQAKSLAPTRMSQDQLRAPSFMFQLLCKASHTGSTLKTFIPNLCAERNPGQARGFLIAQHATPQGNRTFVRTDSHQLMAPLLEMGSQLPKLSWKILMNQQQPHTQTR